jgi:hypothetical protein
MDSHLLAIERAYNKNIAEGLILTKAAPIGWVVYLHNAELAQALNEFTKRLYRSKPITCYGRSILVTNGA